MKKIMIALTVVAFAAIAQAASLNWAITSKIVTESPAGSASAGRASYYTALVFMESDLAAVNSALEAKDFDGLQDLAVSSYQASKTGAFSGAISDLTGTSASIFTVIFDTQAAGDTIDTAQNYIMSEVVTANTYSGTDAPTTASFDAAFGESKYQAIPEPTSGLLLLLGVAGLALKRKRA